MVKTLLGTKWSSMLNSVNPEHNGKNRMVIFFGSLGVLFWLSLFGVSWWFLGKCLTLEPFGVILVKKIVGLVFITLFFVLIISNLVSAFSTFYLADDLKLLMTKPISSDTLYTGRLLESCVQASWMVFTFGLAIFVAAGVVFNSGILYYLTVLAILVPFFLIPTELAVLVSLFLTNVFPARRTRDFIIFLGVVGFVLFYISFRALAPESLVNPEQFQGTMELFSALKTPNNLYLPSTWASETLFPVLASERGHVLIFLSLLYSTAAALFFITFWAFDRLHFSGLSKATEGSHRGSGLERARSLFSFIKSTRHKTLEQLVKTAQKSNKKLNPIREMVQKDLISFMRDTAQWSQLILLATLTLVYLVNYQYFRAIGEGGIIGPIGLYLANVALTGFIITAVSVRFVFPTVSLEGRAFWLIRSAPWPISKFLRAKWLTATIPLVIVAEILALFSNLLLESDRLFTLYNCALMVVLVPGITGLGVGLGAIYPRFKIDNAAKIASGFGGVLFMILSMFLIVFELLLSTYPLFKLATWFHGPIIHYPAYEWALISGVILLLILIPLMTGWITTRLGSKFLEKGEV